MKKYQVFIPVACSMIVEVSASCKDSAISKALNKAHVPSLCHQCAGEIELGDILPDDVTTDSVSEVR